MRRKIENALLELGVTPNLKGFDYICRAVEIISTSKERTKIVDGLYADIAKEFGTTKTRVERGIRHAISKIDVCAWNNYGGSGLKNSEFLYTLALKINQED